MHDGLENLVLARISEVNNEYDLTRNNIMGSLNPGCRVIIAKQDHPVKV